MANINSRPRSRAQLGRNGFDLSFHRSFTSPCGMLLPVAKDFAYSGEKYKLNSSLFIRTQPLQSAAFMRLKAHVEWFFVPITNIFSLWNEFYNQTQDVHSSIFQPVSSGGVTVNSLPTFDLKPFLYNSDPFDELNPGTSTNRLSRSQDIFRVPLALNFRRLWDMLGYGSLSRYKVGDLPEKFMFSLLDFLAYHRIFYSHYNLTDWFPNDPTMFNVDLFYNQYSENGQIPDSDITRKIISTIHYRPWRKDFFTNIFPSPTFSNSFASFLNNSILSENLRPYFGYEGIVDGSVTSILNNDKVYTGEITPGTGPVPPFTSTGTGSTLSTSINTGSSFPSVNISVGDLRAAYAIDKLLRITGSSGSHYDQQTLAHLGVKMPEGLSKEAIFLGAQTTPIQIGEVVSTATTNAQDNGKSLAGSTIGDIAGKGFGSTPSQSDVSFTAPCEGIIMAIFSIEPIPDYASMGLDPVNRYSKPFDFWRPELDNLGMQPIDGTFYDVNVFSEVSPSRRIFGWQYRFSELKQRFDIVNEGFWDTDKYTWIGYRQMTNESGDSNLSPALSTESYFYVPPQYTNTIFLSSFYLNFPFNKPDDSNTPDYKIGYNWNSDNNSSVFAYSGDNFLVDADFKMFKSSPMSVFSLPNF